MRGAGARDSVEALEDGSIATLAVATIYAVGYHRGLAFVAAMFGLTASIAVPGSCGVSEER